MVASHPAPALSWFPHPAYSCICWKVPTCSAELISLLVHHVFDPIAVGQPGVLIISLQGLAGAVGLLGCLAVLTLGWRAGVAALSVAAPSQRSIRFPFFYIHGTLVWVFNIKIMTSVWWSDWNNLKERIKQFMPLGTQRLISLLCTFLHWRKGMLLNGRRKTLLEQLPIKRKSQLRVSHLVIATANRTHTRRNLHLSGLGMHLGIWNWLWYCGTSFHGKWFRHLQEACINQSPNLWEIR